MTRSLAFLVFAACSPLAFEGATPEDALRQWESSAESFATLAFLNDSGTTEALLDDDVGLDVRAARSLIAHRDGPDRVFGTADDDLFDSLAEVDDQYYVGASAIEKIADYADLLGFTPGGSDVVGSWDGVNFTLDEALLTLELANEADTEELDDTVGLDRRAVKGIVRARPIADMNELADAYYVGTSALESLRDYVSAQLGAGPFESCASTSDCADGLVCLGEIAYGTGLFCVDDSMYGTFTFDEQTVIPDDGQSVLTTSVDVQGLATVPVDVVLTLDIDHPRKSDLVVTIDNFLGYSAVVWDREANPSSEIVVRAFPSDDAVNGEYRVHVQDVVTGEQGVLRGWSLFIVSNFD
jgi:hypothetical protein